MLDHSYKSVPSPTPDKPRGLGITSSYPLNTCCLIDATHWAPRFYGDSMVCSRCTNHVQAEEKEIVSVSKELDPISLMAKYVPEAGYEFQMLVFDKYNWNEFRMEEFVNYQGLVTKGHQVFQGIDIYPQKPIEWFDNESLRIFPLSNGCVGVIGKLKEEHQADIPENYEFQENTESWFHKLL